MRISLYHAAPKHRMVEHCSNFLILTTLMSREIHENNIAQLYKNYGNI